MEEKKNSLGFTRRIAYAYKTEWLYLIPRYISFLMQISTVRFFLDTRVIDTGIIGRRFYGSSVKSSLLGYTTYWREIYYEDIPLREKSIFYAIATGYFCKQVVLRM